MIGGVALIGRLIDKGWIKGPWTVDTDAVIEHWREFPAEERGERRDWVTAALRLMNLEGTIDVRGETRELKGITVEDELGILGLLMDEAEALAGDG